jgi:formiminoglutamase
MTDIFAFTNRPDPALFFHRNEPGDPRLGESVLSLPEDYASADVVLLGCPQDEGVRRNGGRPGAAKAPEAIRRFLYRLVRPGAVRFFDLGDTILEPSLEETHAVHQRVAKQILADGKRLVVLGGGNDLSYPDCSALAQTAYTVLAFNIDAHLDVRDNPAPNSGTPYRMLLEEGFLKPGQFYELGYQPFAVADAHLEYVLGKGGYPISLEALRQAGVIPAIQKILIESTTEAIFWGIDMDAVCASDAPGVSAPNPIGLTGDELCRIAALAGGDSRSRVFEITEVNPEFDLQNRTAHLAAVAIFHFLARHS